MRIILVAAGVLGLSGSVTAQFPQQQFPSQMFPGPGNLGGQPGVVVNPNNLMPNIFNPQTQPLSPYLNLLRGSNPAANYYFNVRPGTIGLGARGVGGAPFLAAGGNRTLFFPQLATAPDPIGGDGGSGTVLPPAGHPVVFNNTMGYFPSPFGQAGGARSGLGGLGTTRQPVRK